MKVSKICKEILEICQNDDKTYKEYLSDLDKYSHLLMMFSMEKNIGEADVINIIETQLQLFTIKNRKARYIEYEIARLVLRRLPVRISNQFESVFLREEALILEEKYDKESEEDVKLNSNLLKYCHIVLKQKTDKSKRYKNRVKEALGILGELIKFYDIEKAREFFISRITEKDKGIQYNALDGLAAYYNWDASIELSETEISELEKIIETTDDRSIASSCCQIMINAEYIGEFGALDIMDEWKERNWY